VRYLSRGSVFSGDTINCSNLASNNRRIHSRVSQCIGKVGRYVAHRTLTLPTLIGAFNFFANETMFSSSSFIKIFHRFE